jgi:hypothetical protein
VAVRHGTQRRRRQSQKPPLHIVHSGQVSSQSSPQLPQFNGSVFVLTSQPSEGSPLQSAKGPTHETYLHRLAEQAGPVVWGGVGHAVTQEPQWLTLLLVSTSQPFVGLPSQSWNVPVQVNPHVPDVQVLVAFAREGQMLPQNPQLFGSVPVLDSHPSAAMVLQSMNGLVQVNPHVLPAQ